MVELPVPETVPRTRVPAPPKLESRTVAGQLKETPAGRPVMTNLTCVLPLAPYEALGFVGGGVTPGGLGFLLSKKTPANPSVILTVGIPFWLIQMASTTPVVVNVKLSFTTATRPSWKLKLLAEEGELEICAVTVVPTLRPDTSVLTPLTLI